MILLQYKLINLLDEDENIKELPEFCEQINNLIFILLNTKLIRKKIQLRLNYLYSVPWINWENDKDKFLDVSSIMDSIKNSLSWRIQKNNIIVIETGKDVLIPNTYTSIDRLLRFLNYGDNNHRGIEFLSMIKSRINTAKINSMWSLHILTRLGHMSNIKFISNR